MRGNFLDVPVDCPQRDERLGWTGDIQVFAPTATFLYDTAGFLGSWLADLAAEQYPDGSVPFVIPDVLHTATCATAAWGDAAILVPWTLYQRTADRGRPGASAAEHAAVGGQDGRPGRTRPALDRGFQYGDWLDPTAPEDDPYGAQADPDVIATAHFARSAAILAEAAHVLGEDDLAGRYAHLADEVRSAFLRAYVTPAGRVHSDAQAVYALAIQWDLLTHASSGRVPARDSPTWSAPAATGSAPASSAPRWSAPHSGNRARRRRPPAPAADRVPVVALSGHHGRHHDLGALGQHAARRPGESQRHDLVQPLRPRRCRGLDAPQCGRARSGSSRLSPDPVRPEPPARSPRRPPAI